MKYKKSSALQGLIAALCIAGLAACSNNDDDSGTTTGTTGGTTSGTGGSTDGTTGSTGGTTGTGGNTATADPSEVGASTVLTLQVIDAAGTPVGDADVQVTADSDDIIPAAQESAVSGVSDGIVVLEPATFTGDRTIQVRASKDGFMTNNLPITVTNGTSTVRTITITAYNTTGVGGIGSATVSVGSIQNDELTVFAEAQPDAAEDPGLTFVSIPIDPGAVDRNGNAVGDDLTLDVVHYDADQNTSLDAFPGGLAATIANPDDFSNSGASTVDGGNAVDGDGFVFESAGFAAIRVADGDGNVATNFSKDIDISMLVKSDFVHPTEDRDLVAGDTIPVWRFDEVIGAWSFNQIGQVVDNGSGRLVVNFKTNQLSWYNLAYVRGNTCTINVSFADSAGTSTVPVFNARVSAQGYTQRVSSAGGNVDLINVPAGVSLSLQDAATLDGRTVSLTPDSFSCAVDQVASATATASVTGDAEAFSLTLRPVTFCENIEGSDDVAIAGSAVTIVNGTTIVSGATDAQGEVVFTGLPSGSYGVRVGSSSDASTVAVNGNDTEATLRFPQTCTVTTGGTGSGG